MSGKPATLCSREQACPKPNCPRAAADVGACIAGLALPKGLLSALDVLLGAPIDVVLVSLGPDPELHDTVLGQDVQLGRDGADVIASSPGSGDAIVRTVHTASTRLLSWAVEMAQTVPSPT